MSFHIEFKARNRDDAELLLQQKGTYIPQMVISFIRVALDGAWGEGVHVVASGHLYNATHTNDYRVSNVSVTVTPITFDEPDRAVTA